MRPWRQEAGTVSQEVLVSGEPGIVRRGCAKVWDTIQWIHTGDADMREVFGDNPNDRSRGEQFASAALICGALFVASGS
jgi:hypothetical protein